MQGYLVGALIFALLVAVFAVQNTNTVDIQFIAWRISDISLVLVILGSSVIGAVVVFLLGGVKQLSLNKKVRDMKRQNESLIKEVNELKGKLEQKESMEKEIMGIEVEAQEKVGEDLN
ncbi:MAG: lipopolysaccharide assembly protein LapA domain-containing protein [Bacillota bacterium]